MTIEKLKKFFSQEEPPVSSGYLEILELLADYQLECEGFQHRITMEVVDSETNKGVYLVYSHIPYEGSCRVYRRYKLSQQTWDNRMTIHSKIVGDFKKLDRKLQEVKS